MEVESTCHFSTLEEFRVKAFAEATMCLIYLGFGFQILYLWGIKHIE